MASEAIADIVDIVAEMRRGTKLPGYWRSCDVNEILQYHADRIEAAWERERERAEADALAVGGTVEAMRKPARHAAAMYDALVSVRALIDDEPDGTPMFDAMKATIDAALASPPRNCDVGDAADWEERFGEECDKGHTCSDCPVRHAKTKMAIELDKGARCEFIWVQMPYKEGSAK